MMRSKNQTLDEFSEPKTHNKRELEHDTSQSIWPPPPPDNVALSVYAPLIFETKSTS